MLASESNPTPTFGFMTVVDLGGAGMIGGYLILNALGRPLEFHCTEPVRPNRAQQILYGATLKPYLYGEQIGQALMTTGEVQPRIVFSDDRAVLTLREFCAVPVVCIDADERDESLCSFSIADTNVSVAARHASDEAVVTRLLSVRQTHWCLREPFERIRDALSELQKAA